MNQDEFEKKYEEFIELNAVKKHIRVLKPFKISKIEQFEKKHRIVLPPKFRTFITQHGRGLINKKSHETIFKVDLKSYNTTGNRFNPSLAFPFDCRISFGTFESDDLILRKQKTEYKLISEYRPTKYSNGIMMLEPNDNPFFIVVNGAEYGKVWCDNFEGGAQIMPYQFEDKSRLDFYDFLDVMMNINWCYL